LISDDGTAKKRGGKNEGIFHYVIENKWWKNVRNRPFHYVNEKKGSYRPLSIMLMIIKAVTRSLSEIDFVVFRINNLERFDCL
jgi:hypothetical protein